MKAKPGHEAEVRRELVALVAPSRKDAGCLGYDLHESKDHPGWFLFHENWTDRQALDRHLQKPDLQAALGRVTALLAEPPELLFWENIAP